MSTLLVLTLLLNVAAAPASQSPATIATGETLAQLPDFQVSHPLMQQNREVDWFDPKNREMNWFDLSNQMSPPHTCLKIRAYIFETNDDRVPKFVRETTCGPDTVRTEKIDGAGEPRLVPATAGK